MPPRHVQRRGSRPNLDRRPQRNRSSKVSIPMSWVKLAAYGVAILFVLSLLSRWTALKTIKVSGNSAVSTERITALAQEGARKQLFGRNTALIDTGALASYLEQTEPALKDVVAGRSLPGTLTLKVVERRPGLNWRTGGTTYLLDVDGTVIAPTKGLYARLPVIVDSSNVPVKPGQQAVSGSFVTFCNDFLSQLTAKSGLKAVESTVGQSTSEIYVKTDKAYTLKLDTTRPAAGELADLAAVMGELSRARKVPTQYIDLRVEHKAYYK